jgi:endonuclease/exonuclease/phosphatase family metal-dependent hydrolase
MGSALIVNWNIERQRPDKRRARIMIERIAAVSPDVVCLTEAFEGSTDALGGFEISTPGVAWSKEAPGERKVVLWSKKPWVEPDFGRAEPLQSGAYLTAKTETPLGALRIVGVCIPYNFASPFGQTPKARPWSQHMIFLEGLRQAHRLWDHANDTILLGDFNQFIPRIWGSKAASIALEEAFVGLSVCTGGVIDGVNRPTVDHVGLGSNLRALSTTGMDEHDENGRKLSDHFGIAVRVARRPGV